MNNITNSLHIKTLGAGANNASPEILKAIQTASSKTGVDFSYLVKQASVESSFDADAKNSTSSATGLYQFIDSTWLQMIDRYGEDYGLETNGMSKKEILALRKDPEASSFMAAAFASENERNLNDNWGGEVGDTELYLAHFLGANGASSFLNAKDENPLRTAADLFPAAARSNRNVFYDRETGKARSLQEVYNFFDQKFQNQGVSSETLLAANAPSQSDMANLYSNNNFGQDLSTMLLNTEADNQVAFDRTALSDSIVMQRSQAMREARAANDENMIMMRGLMPTVTTRPSVQIVAQNEQAMPFFTLTAKPVDVTILAQRSDDKYG